jgi:spermidine synthase
MDAVLSSMRAAGRRLADQHTAAVLAIFSGTLFLSALLLFSVQPMFTKMVLPQLGGSPSVWAVSTCFFQAMLLAGYCYAHLLNRYVDWKIAPGVHLLVLAIAFAALPIGLPAAISEPPAEGAYLWLIGILTVGVGLPFFAVSANAPLLQAWFSRTGNPHSADPYFLYGASNFGSLLALLSYPVLIEPMIGLHQQSQIWTVGFLLLAMAIATAGLVMVAANRDDAGTIAAPSADDAAKPTWEQRGRWVLFALVPSGLLTAFTTHLSTDIAAAPFLWVVPLAIFLGTFIVVFRDKPWVPVDILSLLQPAAVIVAMFSLVSTKFDWWQSSMAAFAAFLITTLVAHRALYEDRPAASRLTEFYLWMSLGGVLGGFFAAIVAPQIFDATYEFPLLLLLGMLCRPGMFSTLADGETQLLKRVALAGAAVFAVGLGLDMAGFKHYAWLLATLIVIGSGIPLLLLRYSLKAQAAVVAVVAMTVCFLPSMINRGEPSRSFFGVLRVLHNADNTVRLLAHGTTSHGAQRLVDLDGKKIERPVPSTYYHPESPMAKAVEVARAAYPATGKPFHAGIIGLGAGSMACYSKPEENWRFYEIDAEVVRIAKDASQFNFLSACRPNSDIVLGDARLTVAKEEAKSFDYLQIDAFSSDSVPTHLLTSEAVKLYLSKLSDTGVLVMHVSNRHLDLAPVAAAAALATDGTKVAIVRSMAQGKMPEDSASMVVVAAKSDASFAAFKAWPDAEVQTAATVKAWTDDFSDVISALWRVYGQ